MADLRKMPPGATLAVWAQFGRAVPLIDGWMLGLSSAEQLKLARMMQEHLAARVAAIELATPLPAA